MPAPPVIGIDLGGTQLRCALVRGGEIIDRSAQATDVAGGPAGVLQQIRRMTADLIRDADKPSVAGICMPGPLDIERGVVLGLPTLPGWEQFPIREALQDSLSLPVTLENDAIAATFGEWRQGAAQGKRNLVYVTVSTGIGGGAVVDGKLLHGKLGLAAHVGHFTMQIDGPRCPCGAKGCFEAIASGTALGHRAKVVSAEHSNSYLGKLAGSQTIDAKAVVAGARLGDEQCLSLMAEEGRYLGTGFASLIHLFSPEVLIMGGGLSLAFDLLQQHIEAAMAETLVPAFRDARVVPAMLGDNAGLLGAAALAATMEA
jgi:glucokinase